MTKLTAEEGHLQRGKPVAGRAYTDRVYYYFGCNLLESQVRGPCVLREARLKRSR